MFCYLVSIHSLIHAILAVIPQVGATTQVVAKVRIGAAAPVAATAQVAAAAQVVAKTLAQIEVFAANANAQTLPAATGVVAAACQNASAVQHLETWG